MANARRSGSGAGPPLFQAAAAVFLGSALAASGSASPATCRALVLVLSLGWLALGRTQRAESSRTRAFLLALLLLGACLRAAAAPPLETPSAQQRTAGTWRPTGGSRDRISGGLEGGSSRFAFVGGTVAAGEEVLVLEGEEAPPLAAGPEPGSARIGGAARATREPSPDEVVRLGSRRMGVLDHAEAALGRVRARLLERVSGLRDPLTGGLVAGLLFGDLTDLPHGVGDLFVRTGTFHVLAISGLQVALVAVLLVGPAARLLARVLRTLSRGRVRDASTLLGGVLLILFVPVAGAGPPVLRSALTWVVGSLASRLPAGREFARTGEAATGGRERFLSRTSDPLSIWSLALLAECLLHPEAPFSISVQLTYAATLGLIVAAGPIRRLLLDALPARGRMAATSASGRERPELVRILAQKAIDASAGAIAASMAAVLATIAVVWARFGEWSPAGILATPAIAIPVAWILVAGWIWLAVPGLVPEALLELPSRLMIRVLEAFDRMPGTPCELPPRPLWLLLVASGLTLLALARSRKHVEISSRARVLIARSAALLWASILVPWVAAPSSLEVHGLDVGHGTAVLLRSPGGAVWVFDAGSRDRQEVDREALAPALRAWDAARIGVVLSHPDRDHDGALGWLAERYPPALWAGALPAQVDARLPHTTPRVDVREGGMRLPEIEPAGGGPGLELSRGLDVEGNEGSRTLEVVWGGRRVVLCGDAEAEGLAAWLSARPRRGPVRMLLFPHHGSDTSRIASLLSALQPEEVWISASGTPEVSTELRRRRIPCRITSEEGPLCLRLP